MKKKYLIVGLGITGQSCARYLSARGQLFDFADSREAPPNLASFEQQFAQSRFILGAIGYQDVQDYAAIILSPGFDPRVAWLQQARAKGVPILGEIELFARALEHTRARVIGITGTNGKSTVTVLTQQLLQAAGFKVAVGGNLGTPALDLLAEDIEIYVLELSSFQLETVQSLQLSAAVVLNLSDDHADRYHSFAQYAAQKWAIYDFCQLAVVNSDDAVVAGFQLPPQVQKMDFSIQKPAALALQKDANRQSCLCYQQQVLLNTSQMALKGHHNYANALAALALVSAVCNPNQPAILAALAGFKGLAHRLQLVGSVRGIAFYNDSKATNVGATVAAIAGFDEPVVVLIGGLTKNQNFAPLVAVLNQHRAQVVGIGASEDIGSLLKGAHYLGYADNMPAALAKAVAAAEQQGIRIVLLAPACASQDQYRDFAARGADFVASVQALKAGEHV